MATISLRNRSLLSEARRLLEKNNFDGATTLCRTAVEAMLREALRQYHWRFPSQKRWQIAQIENELGDGRQGIDDFELGRLLGLYHRADIWNAIEEIEGRPAGAMKRLDLNYLREIGNDAVHTRRSVMPSEAQYAVAAAETLLAFLSGFGDETAKPLPTAESLASVTVIEGIDHFFRFIEGLVKEPMIDRVDASRVDALGTNDPLKSSYWQVLRDRTLKKEIRIRRITTLGTPLKTAWLFIKMLPEHRTVLGTYFRLAVFQATLLNGKTNVALPGIASIYSSKDPSLGFALVDYIGTDDDQQRFVFLSSTEVLSSVRHAYAHWFRSAQEIVPDNAASLFRQCYPNIQSKEDLQRLVADYTNDLALDEDAIESTIAYWAGLLWQA